MSLLRNHNHISRLLPYLCNTIAILSRKNHRFLHKDGAFGCTMGDYVFFDRYNFSYDRNQILNGSFYEDQSSSDLWFRYYSPSLGDVIVDVGAHVGTDTVAFAHAVGSKGRVYAIESQPMSIDLLNRNLSENKCSNVHVFSCAVSDAEGSSLVSGLSTDVGATVGQGDTVVTVDTLDNILVDAQQIALLKMNIEGFERAALIGAESVLARCKYVVVACHDFLSSNGEHPFYETLHFVTQLLEQRGFDIHRQYDRDRPWVSYHVHAINRKLVPSHK
jgi:FkbM family methyltransferase